jgi:hypothetical protein
VRRGRLALVASVAGLAVVVAARLASPDAPPLYDGIVPVPPYVWLEPPPGRPGGAQGATATIPVSGGSSPLVAVATPELVPQTQIFAVPEAFRLPVGARSIRVSITPVGAEGAPTDAHIDGNVYRISVTDQAATALTAPESARVSIVMRAADPTLAEGTIARLVDGTWRPLRTSLSGQAGMFIAVVTAFGDFAVLAPGPGPSGAVASEQVSASAGPSMPTGSPAAEPSVGRSPPAPAPQRPAPGAGSPPPWPVLGLLFLALVASASAAVMRSRRRR